MAVRDDKDWRMDSTRRMPSGCYVDDVESEEDYDDDNGDDYDEDEENDDDVAKTGLACPFCFENFDVLGLCCHIDLEHHREAKAAICPVCVAKVEINIVAHLINQHGTILKKLCKKKFRKRGSHSALSILKKESQDEHFQSHLKESSSFESSSSAEPDAPFLSFVYNPQPLHKPEITKPSSEARLLRCNSANPDTDTVESGKDIETCALAKKDQERVQRCEFVRSLLLSTIFNEDL